MKNLENWNQILEEAAFTPEFTPTERIITLRHLKEIIPLLLTAQTTEMIEKLEGLKQKLEPTSLNPENEAFTNGQNYEIDSFNRRIDSLLQDFLTPESK